jgi:hypothetical protein
LSHVTSNSYVGVASVQQADGTKLAKQIIIFPKELRGAAEGSVLLDAPGATTHSRMTSSPIYQHKPDQRTGNFDAATDIGIWICAHVPGLHRYSSPPDWIYNHMSLWPGMLAPALR